MFKSNIFILLIFSIFIPKVFCELKFNNLQEKLVLSLIKVKPRTNVVASEMLVRLALCKLAIVAKGAGKAELMTVLGYKDDASLSTCFSSVQQPITAMAVTDLTLANRIFVNYTKDIDPKFIANAKEYFPIKVEKVGFNYPKAATSFINNLISSRTLRRITDVVDNSDINKQTQMIIVTAAHFKGTWEFPFDLRLTKLTKFHLINGQAIRIPMMTKTDQFKYVGTNECEAISIRFAWKSLLTIVLPKSPQGLPALLDTIYNQKAFVHNLVKRMEFRRPIKVTFPRIKIKTFVDWTGFVQELGLKSIFNATSSGLEGILNNPNKTIALNKIKQKVFVQIDELGVARVVKKKEDMGPTENPNYDNMPQFIADRPFYFDISMVFGGVQYEMFSGVFYGPEQSITPNGLRVQAQ